MAFSVEFYQIEAPICKTTEQKDLFHTGDRFMTETLADRFARYAAQLRFEDLPAAVVHETKRRFIDSFATAVGAMPAEAYAIAKRCALRVSGTPGASILGGGRVQPRMGHLRQRLADPLPRLQRYLSFPGTCPPQR